MRSYTVDQFLDSFVSWSPGPAGRDAALQAALGAALLARAARDEGTRAGRPPTTCGRSWECTPARVVR